MFKYSLINSGISQENIAKHAKIIWLPEEGGEGIHSALVELIRRCRRLSFLK